jgi:hypothetical protein
VKRSDWRRLVRKPPPELAKHVRLRGSADSGPILNLLNRRRKDLPPTASLEEQIEDFVGWLTVGGFPPEEAKRTAEWVSRIPPSDREELPDAANPRKARLYRGVRPSDRRARTARGGEPRRRRSGRAGALNPFRPLTSGGRSLSREGRGREAIGGGACDPYRITAPDFTACG